MDLQNIPRLGQNDETFKRNVRLINAVKKDDLKEVKMLIAEGANAKDRVHSFNLMETYHLYHAGFYIQSLEMLKFFMENDYLKVDTILNTTSMRPLPHFAQSPKNMDMVKYLVEKKADLELGDHHSTTPLIHAVKNKGNLPMVKFLVQAKANIEARTSDTKNTPLCSAVFFNNADAVRYLLDIGANGNVWGYYGRHMPIHFASKEELIPIVKMLVEEYGPYILSIDRKRHKFDPPSKPQLNSILLSPENSNTEKYILNQINSMWTKRLLRDMPKLEMLQGEFMKALEYIPAENANKYVYRIHNTQWSRPNYAPVRNEGSNLTYIPKEWDMIANTGGPTWN
mmetsp:Transcript_14580/g.22126  ORF Transcript_14580/g.22126 Transcript_14580/m.22126 type:complete len:340 (-) Transcript_14580:101-1120(-)